MRRSLAALIVVAAGCFSDRGVQETSTSTTSETTGEPPMICGDGIVIPPEECDAGGANGASGSPCQANCLLHACGDGLVAPGLEACDEGPFNGTGGACRAGCVLNACGDAYVGPGEGCDDGNAVDGDGCQSTCRLPDCGNGTVQEGEECDDADADDTDACTSLCKEARCGDGFVHKDVEQCDDGDLDPHDACTDQCAEARCGDGVLWTGEEQCDDANLQSGDHCSQACTLEKLYVFVTSVRYDAALGGLLGADAKCQQLADAAGVQGIFRAWLGADGMTPASRFTHGLPYTRVDKVAVADNLDAMLATETLLAPISVTENGAKLQAVPLCDDIADKVWTNLDAAGDEVGTADCTSWTATDGTPPKFGGIGAATLSDRNWTDSSCSFSCASLLRLYCFQQMP